MPIFLICVFMFLFLLMIIAVACGGYELIVYCDELMAGIILLLADIGLFVAWLYILMNYVIPRF